MDSSESVTLITPVETLSQRYRPGHQFHVRSWWETPAGRVADLIDAAGVLRISHCPIDRFVSVSLTQLDAETIVSGSMSEEPIVDRATPESAALPGTVDDCPFEPTLPIVFEPLAVPRRQIERLELATPKPVAEYFRPDRLEFYNATCWPLSAEHPRRGEWGPEWQLSPACVTAGERLICHATRLDRPRPEGVSQAKYTGPEWRFWIDLNSGEFREWDGPWQGNAATVSESESRDSEIGSEPQPVDPMPETAPPAVTPHTKPTVAPWLCQFGEYPEPSADWTLDQLRGWRTVRDRDGTICGKFGPDAPEHKHQWAAWLVRVQEFAKGV